MRKRYRWRGLVIPLLFLSACTHNYVPISDNYALKENTNSNFYQCNKEAVHNYCLNNNCDAGFWGGLGSAGVGGAIGGAAVGAIVSEEKSPKNEVKTTKDVNMYIDKCMLNKGYAKLND